ncbi:MAG: alpha/beta fold hydrolase [Rhodospirillaceae bacterium]|nr:alpha/beta fold hydrolase [Rhodospirillaceae bacterium]
MTTGVVFCSGWSTGPKAWDAVRAALPPDLPSAHLNWWEGLANPASAMREAAATANAAAGNPSDAPVIAVAWSLGGQIALKAALTEPERLSALLLIATPVRLLTDETGLGTDAAALRAMRQGLRRDADGIVRAFWNEALAGDRTGFDFDDIPAILAPLDAKTLDAGLAALAETDLRRQLPRIATPVVVMQGDDDHIVGAHAAQQLDDGLSHVSVLAVAGGSHALPLTHPGMIFEVLTALLELSDKGEF